MKEIEKITIERTLGITNHITDWHKCLAALAYAEKRGIRQEALQMIIEKRLGWLNWLTTTQRKWQSNTRNHNKARFNDSISLRENYVRC